MTGKVLLMGDVHYVTSEVFEVLTGESGEDAVIGLGCLKEEAVGNFKLSYLLEVNRVFGVKLVDVLPFAPVANELFVVRCGGSFLSRGCFPLAFIPESAGVGGADFIG